MDQGLKQRLVGAAVLVVLAVIFLPMVLDSSGRSSSVNLTTNIPPKPDGSFNSRVIPLDGDIQAPRETRPAKKSKAQMKSDPPVAVPLVTKRVVKSPTVVPPKTPVVAKESQTKPAVSAWAVQVGSFSGQSNALKLRDRLRRKDYTAFVETTFDDTGKPVYRVRVGPELLRSSAQGLRDKLERDVSLKGIVISYP